MALNNCLKISYKGLTRNIICDTKLGYEVILNTVMEKFNISINYKIAIEFYDEHGYKYNKDTLEYFLLLFPNPQKIFFIRFDSSKILNLASSYDSRKTEDGRIAFGVSKLNNKVKNEEIIATNCEAVPVRRQNCFLGQFPTDTSAQSTHHQSKHMAREIAKRMRLMKQSPPKRKNIAVQPIQKRSMRI